MTVWSLARDAYLEPETNSDCTAALLRSVSTKNWRISLALASGRDDVLKAQSVIENILQGLLEAGRFEALLLELWKTRSKVSNSFLCSGSKRKH